MRVTVTSSENRQSIKLKGGEQAFVVKLSGEHIISGDKDIDPYTGDYEITPKMDEQVLPTAQKLMTGDITIKAIPKEYGLVTYDQSRTITVR